MNAFYLAGRALGLGGNLLARPAVVRAYKAENARLRTRVDELEAEADALARAVVLAAADKVRAEDIANRLATAAREDAETIAAARSVLSDAVDDVIANTERTEGD